jgi:hypothetical protein
MTQMEKVRAAIVSASVLSEEATRDVYYNDESNNVRSSTVLSYTCPVDVIKDYLKHIPQYKHEYGELLERDLGILRKITERFAYNKDDFNAGIIRFIYDNHRDNRIITSVIKSGRQMDVIIPKRPFTKRIFSYFPFNDGEDGGEIERFFDAHVTDINGGHKIEMKLVNGPPVDDPSMLVVETDEFWEVADDDPMNTDIIEK